MLSRDEKRHFKRTLVGKFVPLLLEKLEFEKLKAVFCLSRRIKTPNHGVELQIFFFENPPANAELTNETSREEIEESLIEKNEFHH